MLLDWTTKSRGIWFAVDDALPEFLFCAPKVVALAGGGLRRRLQIEPVVAGTPWWHQCT